MTTGIRHELYLNSSWRDITGDVRGDTAIDRGRGAENTVANPSKCSFVLDNRAGDYVLDNPNGSWYGHLTRNVPHRCSVDATDPYLLVPAGANTASTPDSASLSLTGDLEFQIDLWLPDWYTATDVAGKWVTSGNQRSFVFWIIDSRMSFGFSPDGTASYFYATSNAELPWQYGRYSLKWTYDYDNGAGGRVYRFYYSTTPGLAGSWTQLGDDITGGTPAATYDGTAPFLLGDQDDSSRFYGRIFQAKLLSSIGGTEVANPDFTAESGGTTSFSDDAGNTWTVNGTAEIIDRDFLFHGRVPDFPVEWDATGNDSIIPTKSVDLQRTHEKNSKNKPSKSAYHRGCTSTVAPITNLVAYWPMEEGTEARDVASGLSTGHPMAINGDPNMSTNSKAFLCSDSLPELTDAASFGAPVTYYSGTGDLQVFFLLSVPADGVTTGGELLLMLTTGDVARWELNLSTGGDMSLVGKDSTGTQVYASGGITFGINGTPVRVGIHLTQNGSDTDITLSTLEPQATTGSVWSDTLSSYTINRCTWVAINPHTANAGCAIGHLTMQSAVTGIFDFADILGANFQTAGGHEIAAERIYRLALEDSIPIRFCGTTSTDSFPMGAQRVGSVSSLIRECEETDGGILSSRADESRFLYRTRHSMEAQLPRVSLSYSDSELSPPFRPVMDDQLLVNRLTLSRKDGASYTYEDTDSSADPEDGGDGLYEQEYAVSLEYDRDVQEQCRWRVHLGTTRKPRFPEVIVDLSRSAITGDATLLRNVLEADVGDKIVIIDPPSNFAPEDIELLVVGVHEVVNQFRRERTFVCVPEAPYHTPRFGEARFMSLGSTVNGAHNSTTTSLSVATSSGELWTHADGDFDIFVAGERMTVTGVSGSSSPQTFTVTRSVNGIVKSQTDGTDVELFDPRYIANRG